MFAVFLPAIPLALSLSSSNAFDANLLEAQPDRINGYQSRSGQDILADMEKVIAETATDQ